MRAVDIIRAKRDGHALSRAAIDDFVAGVTGGAWADYQVSALLMAIVLRGMTDEETVWLTDAMVRSGQRLDLSALPGVAVGKHSTGGVGDKTSIVLAPVAAACGVIVPKMSGRGLGHTGGTLDKLEAIPGFRVALSRDEFIAQLRDIGCALISQSAEIVPADKRLYALRDVTATIESLPLIAASVMSKKIAEGSQAVVLDVKCGSGAFMPHLDDALGLARALVAIGEAQGVTTEALITDMETPLGVAVGNALEIAECIEALSGRGPADLEALVIRLGTRMVRLGQRAASDQDAEARVREALASGAALATFRRLVAGQGGDVRVIDDPHLLPQARFRQTVAAPADGVLARVDALAVGRASLLLGAGRDRADAAVDHAAGVRVLGKPGDRVRAGQPLLELHYNDARRLDHAAAVAATALEVASAPPPPAPLVRAWVRATGEVVYS